MPEFLILMHGDGSGAEDDAAWGAYLGRLSAEGVFRGGSAIGEGLTLRRDGDPAPISGQLTGFIRVSARDLFHASTMLEGNPVFEAGGTVEIRALPVTDA